MNLTREELAKAAEHTGLTAEQAETLWSSLQANAAASGKPKLDLAHSSYYLGALIVIGAMGWFMTKAWELFKGPGITGAALAYGLCFLILGAWLWKRKQMRIPSGLLLTMAVCMMPLLTYGIERWTGWWPANDPGPYTGFHPFINGSWLAMEAATIVAGAVALRFWRFPFLTAPIAYALWFMSMDLADLMRGQEASWNEREWITAGFGAAVLLVAYLIDLRSKSGDFAFWGYLFGLLSFWGGLTAIIDGQSGVVHAVYCAINLGLIILALILGRSMFIVFGGLGLAAYLTYLASDVFQDSVLFPVVLSLIGLGVIYFGVRCQKRGREIGRRVRARLAPYLGNWIPARALEG